MVFGKEQGGLYLVDSVPKGSSAFLPQQTSRTSCLSVLELWHCRLGHPSSQHMAQIPVLPYKTPTSICNICPQAKQHRSSFPSSTTKANKVFELLHVDIWGTYRTPTYDGFTLFLSIVDDYSRATWIFLLSHKSNAFSMLEAFITCVGTQFHTQV